MRAFGCLALLGWLLPAPANGQAPCPERVQGWVAALAEGTGTPTVAVRCPPTMVRLRMAPPGVPPMDIEVAAPPGPAFRRAGQLRVSPIVDVPDYGALPEPQRRSFEAAVQWLTEHEAQVAFTANADVTGALHPGLAWVGWWLLGAALLLAVTASWPMRPVRLAVSRSLGVILGSAFTLRALFGLWGPHHINGQGPLWVRGATNAGQLSEYGPGYAEIFGPFAGLGSLGLGADTRIFMVNVALSSLVPALVFVVGRRAGIGFARAGLVATLVVLDPVSVRAAASESYFPILTALTLAVAWLLLECVRQRSRWRAGLLLLAAGLLAAMAARVHPVGWLPLALTPLITLAGPGPRRAASRRFAAAVAVAVAVLAVVYVTSGRVVAAGLSRGAAHHGARLEWHLDAPLLGALALSAALAIATRGRRRWLVLTAAAFAFALDQTWTAYGQSDLWQASYARLFFPWLALGAVAALPGRLVRFRWRSVRWVWLAPLATSALLWGVHQDALLHPTTEQLEYRFLRARFAEIEEPCRVAYLSRVGRRVVELPDYALAQGSGLAVESAADVGAHLTGRACVLFVESSICATDEGRGTCAAIMGDLTLRRLAQTTVPARPSYDGLGYDRDPVPIVIYRVTGMNSSQP